LSAAGAAPQAHSARAISHRLQFIDVSFVPTAVAGAL
jgi:hypothetical protein